MLYLIFSILCSALAVSVARVTFQTKTAPLGTGAVAMAFAAAAAVVFSAVTGQLSEFGGLVAVFGVITGITFAMACYFLSRGLEEKTFALSPPLIRVSMAAPILLALFFIDGLDSVTQMAAIGIVVVGVAAAVLVWEGRSPDAEKSGGLQSRPLNTIFVLAVFAFVFLGMQAFNAVVLNQHESGLFLIFMFASAAVVLLALGMARKQNISGVPQAAAVGLLLFGGYLFLLLSLARLPNWQVFGFVTGGHLALGLAVGVLLGRDKLKPLGYVGLAAAAAGAVLILLS